MAAVRVAGSILNTRWIPCPKMRVRTPLIVHFFDPCLEASLRRFSLFHPLRAFGGSQRGLFEVTVFMVETAMHWVLL